MREQIILECTVCKQRNYLSTRDKRKTPEKIEVKKYCKFDRKHTMHKESK
jgi:large subunit ribosomal protein L33